MKRMALAVTCLALLGSALPCFAQTSDLTVLALAADQTTRLDGKPSDQPLLCISVRIRFGRDLLDGVRVQNVSQNEIVRYRLAWRAMGRSADDASDTSYDLSYGRDIATSLKPGEKEVSPPQGVIPQDFRALLKTKGVSADVILLVGVVYVRFVDGTEWNYDPNGFKKVWRPADKRTGLDPRPGQFALLQLGPRERLEPCGWKGPELVKASFRLSDDQGGSCPNNTCDENQPYNCPHFSGYYCVRGGGTCEPCPCSIIGCFLP